ncbi:LapA family protein [Pelagerythrobacter sp.]|uniref:LapA family protein n=1 Tax=Pelagerythrobacter sp. TaxID=2800702 RepID=UPI0035AE4524
MQVVRTIVWVLLLAALLVFSAFNWTPVEVKIWTNLVLETKIPALVIVSFLLGLVPMWLLHQGTRWRLKRRIGSLETAHRTAVANADRHDAVTTPGTTAAATPAEVDSGFAVDPAPPPAAVPHPAPAASDIPPGDPRDPKDRL